MRKGGGQVEAMSKPVKIFSLELDDIEPNDISHTIELAEMRYT